MLNKGKERDENQFSIYRSFQVGKRPTVEEWHYHWLPIQLLVVVSSDNIHNYHVEVINCKLSYTLSISAKFYLVFVEKCSEKKKLPVNLNCFSLQLQIVIILWFISEAWFPTICKHYLSFSTFRDNNTCCCWKTNSIVSTDEYYQYTPYN